MAFDMKSIDDIIGILPLSSVAAWVFPEEDFDAAVDAGMTDYPDYADYISAVADWTAEFERHGLVYTRVDMSVGEMLTLLDDLGLENTGRNRAHAAALVTSRRRAFFDRDDPSK